MVSVPAKILLMGEYAILKGGEALALPFRVFGGTLHLLVSDNPKAESSNRVIEKYVSWMLENAEKFQWIDLPKIREAAAQGLWFNSNIPQASGLGSSGALVAAIYLMFSVQDKQLSLKELQQRLSQLEAFFHGSSSGVDPLVCTLKMPVHIQKNDVHPLESFSLKNAGLHVFLLPNKGKGRTAELVAQFQSLYSGDYQKFFENEYLPIHQKTIQSVLNPGEKTWTDLKNLSVLQLKVFEFVLDAESKLWMEEGLQSDNFILKLCGSGGGGYLLGFTRDAASTQKRFPNLIWVE